MKKSEFDEIFKIVLDRCSKELQDEIEKTSKSKFTRDFSGIHRIHHQIVNGQSKSSYLRHNRES